MSLAALLIGAVVGVGWLGIWAVVGTSRSTRCMVCWRSAAIYTSRVSNGGTTGVGRARVILTASAPRTSSKVSPSRTSARPR